MRRSPTEPRRGAADSDSGQLIDAVLVEALRLASGLEIRTLAKLGAGHSGLSYRVELGDGRRAVLRLPPKNVRIAGPADIPRQSRLMLALGAAGYLVPTVLASSEEPVIDGRPYLLVEFLPGCTVESLASSVSQESVARSAVVAARRLHAIPLEDTGLAHEPPVSAAAELARWRSLMARVCAPELESEVEWLVARLDARVPRPRPPVLVHGDFHYGNLLFDADGSVVAVLDWEIAEVGERLLDLASLAVIARTGPLDAPLPDAGHIEVSDTLLLDSYGEGGDDFGWYVALAMFKYAAIVAFNLMLHRTGKRPDPVYESVARTVPALIRGSRETLRMSS